MSKWKIISSEMNEEPGRVELGPKGQGAFHRREGEGTTTTVFHYEIRRGLGWVDFEDQWETTGGLIPIQNNKLLLFRIRENYPEQGTWFTDSFVLSPTDRKEGNKFLNRLFASELQAKSLWVEPHDGKAVRAAIIAAGSTHTDCAAMLGVPVSTFRSWLQRPHWVAGYLARLSLFLDTDLIGPYLKMFDGQAWVSTSDQSKVLTFKLDTPPNENDYGQ